MDISDTLAPKSEQLDAIDLIDGPRIFTVERVTRNNTDQPINVHLKEFPRPWRPGVNMRRVLGHCWSRDSSVWTGRRVELYRDPNVTFGKETPGGTRIRRLSHIDGPVDAPILLTRGKAGTWHVEPLPDAAPPQDYTAQIANSDKDQLRALYTQLQQAGQLTDQVKAQITGRVAEIDAAATEPAGDEA